MLLNDSLLNKGLARPFLLASSKSLLLASNIISCLLINKLANECIADALSAGVNFCNTLLPLRAVNRQIDVKHS